MTVRMCMGKPMKLSTIYFGAKNSGQYYKEEPDLISVRSSSGAKLSNSLAGIIFCALTPDHPGITLKVNNEVVAVGQLELLLWCLENAPVSFKAGVAALIEYEAVAPDEHAA